MLDERLMVMVDRYYPQIDTDCVIFDDEIAGYELAKQLLQRGRRRIAVISYFEVEATSVNHRLSGYRRALQQWGLPYQDDLIWLDVYPSFHRSEFTLSTHEKDKEAKACVCMLLPLCLFFIFLRGK